MTIASTCLTCQYWNAAASDIYELGECRALPPAPEIIPYGAESGPIQARWPLTRSQDTCGKWTPLPSS